LLVGHQVDELTKNIRGIHVYDSQVFIDKRKTEAMPRIQGGDEWIPYSRIRAVRA
jgi:hypothetical protein